MREILLLVFSLACLMVNANHWTPNPYLYQNNMTVVGIISFNGEEQESDMLEIGAFCGDECRGSVMAYYEDFMDRYLVCLMIYGNGNDNITFRCYDHSINLELDVTSENSLIFHANDMIGGVIDPFDFSFQMPQYNVAVNVVPDMGGTVSGDGTYRKYDKCYVEINPNSGYQFEALVENGDTLTTQQTYSFVVLSDRHIEAHFSEMPIYYQITAEANPATGGMVTGIGQYLEGDECSLHIAVNSGYDYLGLYEDDLLVTTDTVYSFVADSDRHFVAKFSVQINYYQVSADILPNDAGEISGLGAYQEGETCELQIVVNEGYDFVALKENDAIVSEELSYSFVVDSDRHFMAEFALKEYTVSFSAEPEEGGSVTESGTYHYGETVYAIAVPSEDYIFDKWTKDGMTVSSNPQYVFNVTEAVELVAYFIKYESVDENGSHAFEIYPNPVSDYIMILSNHYEQCEITIYNILGRSVIKTQLNHNENMIDVAGLSSGTYIMSISNGTSHTMMKFVKE